VQNVSRFDRYVLSQLLALFGFFTLVLVAVYWVNRAVSLFDALIGDGQTALVFLEFSALTLPNVIRVVLPISAFAATVYVINRMSTESELVVMQSTGFSPWRMARPVLVFGVIVALVLSLLMHFLVPASRAQMSLRSAEISENIVARFLTEGRFLHPVAGVTLYVRELTPEGVLKDLFLSDARQPSARTDYTAQEAFLVRSDGGPRLVMVNGLAQAIGAPGQRLSTTSFDSLTFDLATLISSIGDVQPGARELPTPVLLAATPEAIAAARSTTAEFRFELMGRFAQPLLATFAALIGFSALMLGGFSRFGVARQVLGAVTLLIGTQVLSNAAAGLALRDAALAPLAFAPVVFAALAVAAMLYWAARSRRPAPGRRMAAPPQATA
jgi:lipopolysaccharide export system permease protein